MLNLLHAEAPAIGEDALRQVDLKALVAAADQHRVTPQLLDRLKSLPEGTTPADWSKPLLRLRQAWAVRAMMQERDLHTAADILHEAGITPLVLKGPAMARFAYDDPGQRAASDLDLLVPSEQYADAARAIYLGGFRSIKRYPAWFHYHDVFRGPARTLMELHWGLTKPDSLFHLSSRSFMKRGVRLNEGLPVLWSPPDDLLLHTAGQCLTGGFSRLARIVDADHLLRRHSANMDWERILHDARHGGLGPSLWLLLNLASRLLGTPPIRKVESLRPPWAARIAMESLRPGRALLSGFSIHYPITHNLYQVWLAQGFSRQCRAAIRIVRLPRLRTAYRRKQPGLPARFAGFLRRLVILGKLTVYQVLCLLRHSFHRPPPSAP